MGINDKTIKEFFDYYKNTPLPDPDHYPMQFQFLIDSFVHHKNMKKGTQVENV